MNFNFNSLNKYENFIGDCNQLLSPLASDPPPTPEQQRTLSTIRASQVDVQNTLRSLLSPIHQATRRILEPQGTRASGAALVAIRVFDDAYEAFLPYQVQNLRDLGRRILKFHPDDRIAGSLVELFQKAGAPELIYPFNQNLRNQYATDRVRLSRLPAPEHNPEDCFKALSELTTPDNVLIVNGQAIPLFSHLLKGRSGYFKGLLNMDCQLSGSNRVLTPEDFSDSLSLHAYPAFFAYLYTGVIDPRYAMELRDFADFFSCRALEKSCQAIIEGEKTLLQEAVGTIDLILQAKKEEYALLDKDVEGLTNEKKGELKNFVVVCHGDGKIVALFHKALFPAHLLQADLAENLNTPAGGGAISSETASSKLICEECVIYRDQSQFSNALWADIRNKLYLGFPYNPNPTGNFSFEILSLLTEFPSENFTENLDLQQIKTLFGAARLISKTFGGSQEGKNILRKAKALSLLYFAKNTEHRDFYFLHAISHFKYPTNAHFARIETLLGTDLKTDAVKALGAIGGNKALELLKPLVVDQRGKVRECVAYALGNIGGNEALRLLESLIGDPANNVRRSVATALGLIGGNAAFRRLILGGLIADPDFHTRTFATIQALGCIGDDEGLRHLEGLITDPNFHDHALVIIQALGCIVGESLRLLEGLLADQSNGIRSKVVIALGRIGGDEARRLLRGLIADQHAGVRSKVVIALGHIEGDEAHRLLGGLVRHPEFRARAFVIIQALGLIGGNGVLGVLESLIEYSTCPFTREFAIQSLGRIGGGEALRILERLIADQSSIVRLKVAIAVICIGGDKSLRLLERLARDPNNQVRRFAAQALDQIGHNEARRLSGLEKLVRDEDVEVRKDAAEAMRGVCISKWFEIC